jgi:chemotaxis protein histidine kinase CheA
MADDAKTAVKVRLYRFRNVLKEKTAGTGGGPITIDPKALEAANAALQKMAEDYPDWVIKHVEELRTHHARCVDTPTDRRRRFAMMREIAHDMKGQGGTFGYPLITTFATSLYDCVGPRSGTSDDHIEIVKSHIDSMAAVIKDRVKGNGGEIGKALTQGLKDAIERYSKLK